MYTSQEEGGETVRDQRTAGESWRTAHGIKFYGVSMAAIGSAKNDTDRPQASERLSQAESDLLCAPGADPANTLAPAVVVSSKQGPFLHSLLAVTASGHLWRLARLALATLPCASGRGLLFYMTLHHPTLPLTFFGSLLGHLPAPLHEHISLFIGILFSFLPTSPCFALLPSPHFFFF